MTGTATTPAMTADEDDAAAAPVGYGASPAMYEWVRKRVLDRFNASEGHESPFERAVHVAQQMFGVDLARLALYDMSVEWARDASAAVTRQGMQVDEFSRLTLVENESLYVVDAARDPRFKQNPLVRGAAGIRFLASVPVLDPNGTRIGSFRLTDARARILTEGERYILGELVMQVEKELVLRRELEQVAAVQRSLAPRPVSLESYDIGGRCDPARIVGGDFYDWYQTPTGLAFTLGDVMGKGIGAAMVAATVRGVMRSGARSERLERALDAATAALDTDHDGTPAFVTLFHGRLDVATGRVVYADAGHGLALLIDGRTRVATRLSGPDLPLGIQPEGDWHEQSITLKPGDTLISVSDGVLDSFDGSLLGLEELDSIAVEGASAQEIADAIVRRAGGSTDDVTALVVRRTD